MSKNLEDVLRDLVAAGELSHLSITPSQNGKMFRTSFAMCSKFGIRFAEDADPVASILRAITTAKTKKPPHTIDLKATRITPELSEPETPHPSEAVDDLSDLM